MNGNSTKRPNVCRKSVKQNQNNVKQNVIKSKSSEKSIVLIDLISSDGSDVNNKESEVEEQTEEEEDSKSTDDEGTEVEEEDAEEEEEFPEFLPQKVEKKASELSAKFCESIIGDKQKLYSVSFNTYLPDGHNYFATAGGDRVTIYECLENGSIRLVKCFGDCVLTSIENSKEKTKTEDFYSCCWSYDNKSGNPLVIAGGRRAIIRVIDCSEETPFRHLLGHGEAINDLKVSPFDHNLLLSSSEDHSLRLWNIKSSVCVVKFGGESGHRDQVICADFYLLSDKYFVSTGMDHSIKIWSLNSPDIRKAIIESNEYHMNDDKSFPMRCQHFPVFTTRNIHSNYIDCVQFFGKFLLSKSCNEDQEIVCTKSDLLDTENGFQENGINEDITRFNSFELRDASFWFIKFSMDFCQTLLSIGNNNGLTFVWDMTADDPFEYEPLVLERKKCKSTIRQTSFSKDGKTLICVCDDSSIWRWSIDTSNMKNKVEVTPNKAKTVEQNHKKSSQKKNKSNESSKKSETKEVPMAQLLSDINTEIKQKLTTDSDNKDIDGCLETFKILNNLNITHEGLEEYGNQLNDIMVTLEKCRKDKHSFKVREMSQKLHKKFNDLMFNRKQGLVKRLFDS